MPIRLQTARGTEIQNGPYEGISRLDENLFQSLVTAGRTVRRGPSLKYNCHGLTFAARRTGIFDAPFVSLVLTEDGYEEIPNDDAVLPGDVVVYYSDDGDPSHSGIVLERKTAHGLFDPFVVSKFGKGHEFVHRLWDVPNVYGRNIKYYRCRLT
jgi:hypothetical protein